MINSKVFRQCLVITTVLALTACIQKVVDDRSNSMSENLYNIPTNCDFMSITSGSQENECSPKLSDPFFSDFSGILINGPKQISWPGDLTLEDFPPGPSGTTEGPLRLMVAGLIRIKYDTYGLKGDAGAEVLVVAINQKTAQTYKGKMPKADSEPFFGFMPDEPERTEDDKNALLSSHFNLDLVHDLEIPLEDATYSVYATLGEYKSNVLTIHTMVK